MSISKLLNPNSIAVIGASSNKNKLGWQILNNLVSGDYKGKIYPVNPKERTIQGLKVHKNVKDIAKKVDLAVIVIPAQAVSNVLEDCGDKGVKNVIIISAGFSEAGFNGKQREQTIKRIADKYGMNVLGPNCLGIINNIRRVNATFADAGKQKSNASNNVAFISQSGAIGSAILDRTQDENWGLSHFVSLGNKAVLDENEFLEYFKNDKRTKVVALYLEEIINGRRFMEMVSRLSRVKPVIVLKTGKTQAGKKATMSHTGSLAGSNQAVEAGLKRSGAVVVDSLKDFFTLINFFSQKKEVDISDTFIVSNAGGPLVAATDELQKYGLGLSKMGTKTQKELKKQLKGIAAQIDNPLDVIGDADADRYEKSLDRVLKDDNITNVLVILTPQTATQPQQTAQRISKLNKKYKNKLIVASFMGGESLKEAKKIMQKGGVPNFQYPGEALYCLARSKEYSKVAKGLKVYTSPEQEHAQDQEGGQMDYLDSFSLFKKFDIPYVKTRVINNKKDLGKVAYPIVLKIAGPNIIHKTDKNAVVLNIEDEKQAVRAFDSLSSYLKKKDNYCVAQPMIKEGVEMIIGFKRDESFGPILMVGAGGIYTEILQDVETEVDDVNLSRAMSKIKQLQIYPLLAGARGQQGYNVKALAQAVVNMAKLAKQNPEIKEVDINPLFVTKKGVIAADARIIY